ncbi:MAG: hypothetical protein DRO18_00225 [Thermoprotei archaeon]|mgnify:CR=1 FL=1|nr:MAG: hypothetical protein DRO18_00225 [Thermoprotei archaeon]
MFKVVLRVEFELLMPSEIVENIHKVRDVLKDRYGCTCSSHIAPLLCECSSVMVKLFLERRELRTDIRMGVSPSFIVLVEGTSPKSVIEVLDRVVNMLKERGAKVSLIE